jgi:hypothetical protein
MADEPQAGGVVDKASETIVLGVELVGAELDRLPERLAKALTSAEFQQAIRNALDDFALNRLKKTPSALTPADAQALAEAVLKAGEGSVSQQVLDGIKKSSHYQALDQSLKDLTDALKKSPMGVWVDRNKGWLYILGAGGILAGAAAMYVLRTGDDLTKRLMPLVHDLSASFTPIGKLTLTAGLASATFIPSERRIEAKTFVTAKWEGIEAKFNLAVTAADKQVTASVDGHILIPITKSLSLQPGGAYDSATHNWSLSVGLKAKLGGGLELGVFAGVGKPGPGAMPGGDAFKAIPTPPTDSSRPSGFVGLGISGHF